MNKLILSLMICIVTYFFIFTNRRIRETVAFFGALLTIALGLIEFDQAISYIDLNKLAIIIGMMIFTIITKESGVFQYLAIKATKFSKGNPLVLLLSLSLLAGFLSSILDEIITLLFLANITLLITNILEIPSLPFLISEIIFANIGGLATYIGTPANIMIGSSAKLSFYDFIYHMAPISLLLMLISAFYLANYFKKTLQENNPPPEIISRFSHLDEKKAITNLPLLRNSLGILVITIIISFLSPLINLPLGTIYLLGAIILLLISPYDADEIYPQIDWKVIFFLAGLNILAGALEENGLIKIVSSHLLSSSGEDLNFLSFYVLGLSTFLSSFFDNIPIIVLAIPILKNIFYYLESNSSVLWWVLVLGANIGANGTLISTASNLTVADLAEKNKQPIPFWYFTKVSFPLVIINLIVASFYIYLRYLV